MRLVWTAIAVICVAIPAIAQGQQFGGANNNNNNGGGDAPAAGGGSGGQGAGGTSDLLETAFGERTNVNETTGFIGGNANALQGGFVGQNPAGQGGQFGNTGGFQGGGRGGNAGGGRGAQQPQRQQSTNRQIRTRLVLPADFAREFRILPPARIQNALTTQYRKIDQTQSQSKLALGSSRVFRNANINVTANGRTVVLRGQVLSDRERRLAARIASLEPGVDRVDNQLTVVSQ